MKKSILFLMILGLCFACDNNNVINADNNTTSNTNDTDSTSVVNNGENEDDNTIEPDRGIEIDPNECYMLQEFNELGEPVESYQCIVFEKNAGRNFEEAFESIKPEIDALLTRNVNDEKDGGNYDASKWELRQIVRNVKNSPDEKLVYTSIELYMFSIVYNTFTIVYQYYVIDSEGNIYQIVGPTGGEDDTIEPKE